MISFVLTKHKTAAYQTAHVDFFLILETGKNQMNMYDTLETMKYKQTERK